jgi:hypothetical protein
LGDGSELDAQLLRAKLGRLSIRLLETSADALLPPERLHVQSALAPRLIMPVAGELIQQELKRSVIAKVEELVSYKASP